MAVCGIVLVADTVPVFPAGTCRLNVQKDHYSTPFNPLRTAPTCLEIDYLGFAWDNVCSCKRVHVEPSRW